MRQTEAGVRSLVEAGNGCKRKVSDDLTAWIMPYEDGMIDIYVHSASVGRTVFETEMDTRGELGEYNVEQWLMKRKVQHEADMACTVKCGTAYVKEVGEVLHVMLLSDADNVIDTATIEPSDFYEWLESRLDW